MMETETETIQRLSAELLAQEEIIKQQEEIIKRHRQYRHRIKESYRNLQTAYELAVARKEKHRQVVEFLVEELDDRDDKIATLQEKSSGLRKYIRKQLRRPQNNTEANRAAFDVLTSEDELEVVVVDTGNLEISNG